MTGTSYHARALFGFPEARVYRRYHEIRGRCDGQSCAQRRALHRYDDGNRAILNGEERCPHFSQALVRVGGGESSELGQIVPAQKCGPAPLSTITFAESTNGPPDAVVNGPVKV